MGRGPGVAVDRSVDSVDTARSRGVKAPLISGDTVAGRQARFIGFLTGTVPAVGAALTPDPPPGIEVRRSRRRRRTVTAYRDGDVTVVMIPARFTAAQEREWVDRMVARLSAQDRRRRPGDADLSTRAAELSRRYLDGLAQPASVS